MTTSYDQILEQLAAYLEYRRDEGDRSVELDPALLAQLRSPAPAAAPAPAPAPPPPVPRAAPVAAPAASEQTLESIAARIANCRACALCETRTRTVPGQGNSRPEIMFIGEAPGADEDQQGLAFVGAAGQLLTKMIGNLGLTRDEVFIGNILKCRPPGNRVPHEKEMTACLPFLRAQVALLQPRVIVALGGTASKGLLQTQTGITRLRGEWQSYEGIDLMPTFHPSFLLRPPFKEKRWQTWTDMLAVLERIGRTPPEKA